MNLQTLTAFAIVLAAVVYLVRRFLARRRAPGSCPGCKASCRRDSDGKR